MRANNRTKEQLRPFSIEKNYQPNAYASVLIKTGNTHVICGVTVEEKVPPFLKDTGQGWITAEYGILPCATQGRYKREVHGRAGRTYEIQRLIGRSLRMMVDLGSLGERTLRIDCDVLNADGGTRTASITGAAIALHDALLRLVREGFLSSMPEIQPVAAVSVGIVNNEVYLDLDYSEDSNADADGNFVMSRQGEWIEIQSTAEGRPVKHEAFMDMLRLAADGIEQLFTLWDDVEAGK